MTKTAILLSGGVDSLVAAYILKQQGQDLVGIHFTTGFEKSRTAPDAAHTAAALAEQLHIPVEVMDCRQEFQAMVVDYFTRTYAQGKTPNPCLVCNPAIKFGLALSFARTLGAGELATGHYARTRVNREGLCRLLRGKDHIKDQSYFLARLSQKNLSRARFPLGDMTKSDTFNLAGKYGLKPTAPQESQDICFIPEGRYSDFLMRQPGFDASPGPIKDVNGNTIGRHSGLHLYTIGQRRGINCPARKPYYVIAIDAENNCLKVGFKNETLTENCRVEAINWIHPPPAAPMHVRTRVRYRHHAALSRLVPHREDMAIVHFESPQSAVTPGQGAVFYSGDEVLGGGWIV